MHPDGARLSANGLLFGHSRASVRSHDVEAATRLEMRAEGWPRGRQAIAQLLAKQERDRRTPGAQNWRTADDAC